MLMSCNPMVRFEYNVLANMCAHTNTHRYHFD